MNVAGNELLLVEGDGFHGDEDLMMEILWFYFRAELWMDGRMFTSLQNDADC